MKNKPFLHHNSLLLFVFAFCLGLSLQACGQNHSHQIKGKPMINYERITDPIVRKALQAWQEADRTRWKSMFADDASLTDDGHPRNLEDFSKYAIGDEYFLTIDKIEDHGRTVTGQFHTKKYGDFIARFHFEINDAGKIFRLDIGMVGH